MNDPIEDIVAQALAKAGIEFVREPDPRTLGLDFYLPDYVLFIECKQYHSDRIAKRMARVRDIIAIQGRTAALAFTAMLQKSTE